MTGFRSLILIAGLALLGSVAIAQPPTRRPLRRIRPSMVDTGLEQHKPALIHD